MDAQKIIDRLGGTAKTAKLFNITPGAVSQWIHSGIPPARLMFLRIARPDVFDNIDAEADDRRHSRERRRWAERRANRRVGPFNETPPAKPD